MVEYKGKKYEKALDGSVNCYDCAVRETWGDDSNICEQINKLFAGVPYDNIYVCTKENTVFKLVDEIEQDKTPFDTQIGGEHYQKMKIQPTEFIMANGLNWCQGNIIKYVCRYKDKNGIEDLEKAEHYIKLLIKIEKDNNGNS